MAALGAPEQSTTQLIAVEQVASGSFAFTFNGVTSGTVNNGSGNATAVQQVLQEMPNIGGVGGTVTVTQMGSSTVAITALGTTITTLYSVTFGGRWPTRTCRC